MKRNPNGYNDCSTPKPEKQEQGTTPTTQKPTFEDAKRAFELAYAAGDYAKQLKTLGEAVALSVLKKCIDPQRKTAGMLDTVSKSGLSGALLDLRRGIHHDTNAFNRVDKAGETVVLTRYTSDGDIDDDVLDPDDKALFDAVIGDTISDGYDLVQTAVVTLLEQALDHAGDTGWLDTPYTVQRPSRKVLIKTGTLTIRNETTTPIQEVYRAVRRAISSSRSVQTNPRNGYTYIEVETPDGMDTVYQRTGRYADLGGYTRSGPVSDALPGAPVGLACGYNPYTAGGETVKDYYAILDTLDLTRRQREIVEYRMQGYGYRAIASRLGVTLKSVQSVVARVRSRCVAFGITPPGYTDTADK